MRKTTDPKERKYLVDREFNTFGRGAIEDAPAELLYGKGALAEGFNVNCHKSYIEGRTGSRLFGDHAASLGERIADAYKASDYPRRIRNVVTNETDRYIDWVVGGGFERDIICGQYTVNSGWQSNTYYKVEDDTLRSGQIAVVRGKPTLMAWHKVLHRWVRVEDGKLWRGAWNMRRESYQNNGYYDRHLPWWLATLLGCSPILGDRVSFIETASGGFLYSESGIYRWRADEGEAEDGITGDRGHAAGGGGGTVFKINIDAPVKKVSEIIVNQSDCIYRYLFTGARLRGKSRIADPANTIADFETPTHEHNFLPFDENGNLQEGSTGLFMRGTPITGAEPAQVSGLEWLGGDIGAMTHIGVYRTLNLQDLDADAVANAVYNSPNRFALVADVPLSTVYFCSVLSGVSPIGTRVVEFYLTGDSITVDGTQHAVHIGPLLDFDVGSTFKALPLNGISSGEEPLWDAMRVNIMQKLDDSHALGIVTPGAAGWPSDAMDVPLLIYSEWSDTAFAASSSGAILTWCAGVDVSSIGLTGKQLFLSNGEAYGVAHEDYETDYSGVVTGDKKRIFLTRNERLPGDINNPILLAAVVPSAGRAIIDDNVSDEILRPRLDAWYPKTRFCVPLPNCNIAADIPGFVVCAIEGEGKIYYTGDDSMGGYTYGCHNPVQTIEQIKDGITHVEGFTDTLVFFVSHSTWSCPVGLVDYYVEPGSGWTVPLLLKATLVDANIGLTLPRTAQRLSDGRAIMLTQNVGGTALRTFDGHRYGDNLLRDAVLGLSRNQNRARDIQHAVAIYHDDIGYIVWATGDRIPQVGEDTPQDWSPHPRYRTISSYCFRVAVLPEQGGGITEYGGEQWAWPDADAATVSIGYAIDDDNGRLVPGSALLLVEDARSGRFLRIGSAEVWKDRADSFPGLSEGGHEIETRFALPVISDGYKWQKHLETHIAMRCWRIEYSGAVGFTDDGFKPEHKVSLSIYEDGERIAESSALHDINRNGDYAYLKKIDARRIQEVIETTTSAYKVSQVVTKIQSSDRNALPIFNEPLEVSHQREWRDIVIHLSRNLPHPLYNRADGNGLSGNVLETAGPFDRDGEAFRGAVSAPAQCGSTSLTLSAWVNPVFISGDIIQLTGYRIAHVLSHEDGEVVYSVAGYLATPGAARAIAAQGVWTHVAVVVDGPGLRLFVNGEMADSGAVPAGVIDHMGINVTAELFDVRLIDCAVSPESIKAYYDAVRRGGEGWLP